MSSLVAGLAPETRTATFYSTLFLTQGVFTAVGSIWMASLGLSSTEIGIISSTPVLIMLLLNLVVGRVADRAKDWRQVIVVGALASGVLPIGLIWAETFWPILIFWTLGSVSHAAVVPVIDAAAMRLCLRNGRDFGKVRAWATVGYVVFLLATGFLARHYGPAVFLPIFIAGGLIRGLSALVLPTFRATGEVAAPGARRLREAMQLWFILPLFGWAIVFSTHLILNSFQNLLWQRQGLPLDLIGVLIAVGAASEAVMFFAFRRFSRRLSPRIMILTSGIVSCFRWTAMAFAPGIAWLFALQLLHSVTYAMGFLACVNFIAKWTAEDIAAEAQSFFVVMQQGCAVLALFLFGTLADTYGASAYFASTAIAALGTLLILASIVMKSPE